MSRAHVGYFTAPEPAFRARAAPISHGLRVGTARESPSLMGDGDESWEYPCRVQTDMCALIPIMGSPVCLSHIFAFHTESSLPGRKRGSVGSSFTREHDADHGSFK